MNNRYDIGAQEDFDNCTKEIARKCLLFLRDDLIDSNGKVKEANDSVGYPELIFLQPLNEKHELIDSGELSVGSVRLTFMSNSRVEPESLVTDDDGKTFFKVIRLTKARGQSNNKIIHIKAFGYKLPNR